MAFSIRTWFMLICTCNAYLMLMGVSKLLSRPAAEDPYVPPRPIDIDKLVTPWSDFGFSEYTFMGTWGNETYQAAIWLRLYPTSNTNERAARVVIQLNRAPTMSFDSRQLHAMTPKEFLLDGKLPALTLTSIAGPGRPVETVEIKQQYWDDYITSQWLAGTVNGAAMLKADTTYTLSMEGSPHLFQIPAFRGSKPNAIFQDGDVWIGMVESMVDHRRQQPFQFLVLEHLRYHLRLGFRGTLMVVVPETAALLLGHREILEVVKKKQLVLVLWEHGYEQGKSYMMQLPANNLLKTAMAGSSTTLGLWDLDEFLVLPRHRNISYEVSHGCLTQLGSPSNMEAVLAFSMTVAKAKSKSEIRRWQKAGGFEAAVKSMRYTTQPYKHCNYGVYCKALVNPNSDYNMHVHQLARPPSEGDSRNPTPRSCAYIHHFFYLWGTRWWWDPKVLSRRTSLSLKDMPFSL